LVAEGVVDLFEPVEVQEQHGHGGARASGGAQSYTGPVREQGPVRKVSQRVVQGLVPVMLAFGVKVPLVAGHDDCSADDQADCREQRGQIDEEHETADFVDRRRRAESPGFVSRGRGINLAFHDAEDRVDGSGVYGVRHGHRIVAVNGQEQLRAGCDVGFVLAQHHLGQVSVGAVTQRGHLEHCLLEGGFGRCVGCLRDRSGLETILPLERLLGGDRRGRVFIRVSGTNSKRARRGRIARHQGTSRNNAYEPHQCDAGPGHRPSIPQA
jgi:hypothetical protein